MSTGSKELLTNWRWVICSLLIFAFFPMCALLAQPLGMHFNSPWWPAVLIGLAMAGHQAWSANMYSLVGDMFPKSTIASLTGMCSLFGGIAYLFSWCVMKVCVPKYKPVKY